MNPRTGPIALVLMLGVSSVAQGQTVTGADEADLDGFLRQSGEDLDGCFKEAVEMKDGPKGPDLEAERPAAPRRVVVAVDSSGSMAGSAGGMSKMEAAKAAVGSYLGGLPRDVEVGLVAFGHKGDNQQGGKALSCGRVEVFAAPGRDRAHVRSEVKRLSATGWTPLAAAISAAGAELESGKAAGEQVVYVVSDGEETCGGDPIAAARALHEGGVRAVVNVIGLDLPASDRAQLEAVAGAGGGSFEAVKDGAGLLAAMSRRAKNLGEMTRVRAMSGHATRANNSAVGGAMLRINACVAGIVTRENRKFGGWRKSQREAGASPEALRSVKDSLRGRHDAARMRARSLYEAFRAEKDRANDAIRESRDDAERAFDGE